MKIVVLGGCGRVGRRVAEILLTRGETVTRADRLRPASESETDFRSVDIARKIELTEALAPFDVVVNCVGPFGRWGARVLDAAIEAQSNYVDICDDPVATLELLQRDAVCKDRGIRAVIGSGASPGLTNHLASVAAHELDKVQELMVYWGWPNEGLTDERAREIARRTASSFRSPRVAWEHMVSRMLTGTVPLWRNGALVEDRPWKRAFRVTLSGGESGVYRVVGHPEAITLPRVLDTTDCFCAGSFGAGLDRLLADAGDEVTRLGVDWREALTRVADRVTDDWSLLIAPGDDPPHPPIPSFVGAVAVGSRHGTERSVVALPGGPTDGSTNYETARVAALAAELIGTVPVGVRAPESAFRPQEFLSEFGAREWPGEPPYRIDDQEGRAVKEVEVEDSSGYAD